MKIQIEVEKLKKDVLHLTETFGSGDLDGTKFEASFILPNYSLQIEVGKNKYVVSQTDIIHAVIAKHLNEK